MIRDERVNVYLKLKRIQIKFDVTVQKKIWSLTELENMYRVYMIKNCNS